MASSTSVTSTSTATQTLSNFEKVKEFNDAFQNRSLDKLTAAEFETEKDIVQLCLSLIEEEVQELKDAIADKDPVETRDALADILYVTYGMQYRLGIRGDDDFAIVHSSNMSKLCVSEEEAQETVAWYEREFAEGKKPYDTPYYEKVPGLERWVIKNRSTGKVLKSINYTPVKWMD
jgi:predicted HAD superfamily Cof-like phosphohydrolase